MNGSDRLRPPVLDRQQPRHEFFLLAWLRCFELVEQGRARSSRTNSSRILEVLPFVFEYSAAVVQAHQLHEINRLTLTRQPTPNRLVTFPQGALKSRSGEIESPTAKSLRPAAADDSPARDASGCAPVLISDVGPTLVDLGPIHRRKFLVLKCKWREPGRPYWRPGSSYDSSARWPSAKKKLHGDPEADRQRQGIRVEPDRGFHNFAVGFF